MEEEEKGVTGDTPPEEHEEITDEHIAEVEKTDPDKAAHLKAQQKAHEPKPGSERWKKIYAEAMEYRRSKDKLTKTEELEKRLADKDQDIKLLREHNQAIIEALKTNPKKEVEEHGKKPEEMLADLRAAKAAARKDLDYDKAFEIQDQIDDLLIAMQKAPKSEKKVDTKEEINKAIQEEKTNEAVQDFVKANKWFSKLLPDGKPNPEYDVVKSGAAQAMERDLLQGWKGSYRELLQEVEKQIGEKFPAAAKTKLPAAAGVGGGGGGGNGKVTLSAEQKRIIANMFPDDPKGEERYIAQLQIIQGGRA